MNQRPKILFIHNALTEFVRLDLEALRAFADVTERFEPSRFVNPVTIWRDVQKHDLVFGWFASWHTFLPVQFAKRLGKPALLVCGGYDAANMPEIGYGHQRGGLKKWVSRRSMRDAKRVITNSEYSRAEIARNIGLTNGRVQRIFHGVPDRCGQLPQRKERLALTVGNVDRSNLQRKGHEPFVRAASLLPDVKFVLVGDWKDDAIDYLRSIAAPNVEFTGRVSHEVLDEYYRRASVYVQPSLHEGFGMSVAEAMLAGCVPVTTNAGALPEITEGVGVQISSTEAAAVARGIENALNYSQGVRGKIRQRILDRFPMSGRAKALRELIQSVTGPQEAQPLTRLPFVSVLLPVRNEEAYIARTLAAVIDQDYPAERLEVIVADGISTDSTRKLVSDIASHHSNVVLIDNPEKIVATGLNAALRVAAGEVIIRVDGHTIIQRDYVRACVEALAATEADNVGGRMRAVSDGLFGRAVAAATSSRFGVGGARFHYSDRQEWVDTVYLGAWRREVFDRIGSFDEEMVRNQDDEFNYRLRASGGEILLSPKIKSSYYNRTTPLSLWTQYFQYGYWKVRVLQKHPRQMQLRQFVPAVFILGLLVLALMSALVTSGWLALVSYIAGYFVANFIASILVAWRSQWTALAVLPVTFLTIHFAYGCGFIVGLARFWNRWEFTPAAKTARPAGDVASL